MTRSTPSLDAPPPSTSLDNTTTDPTSMDTTKEPPTPEQAEELKLLKQLRKDYRMMAISQFINLLRLHINLEFDIELLEWDLIGKKPLSVLPTIMGKILSTLGNDRNTNASNWQTTLRRQHLRRMGKENTPFSKFEMVDVVSPLEESIPVVVPPTLEEPIQVDIPVQPAGEVTTDAQTNGESSAQLATSSSSSSIAAASAPLAPPPSTKTTTTTEPVKEQKEISIDIDWQSVSLETKISSLYRICEWNFLDPERLRKQMKWELDTYWRMEPIGKDKDGNKYFYTEDQRLWIQRPIPRGRGGKVSLRVKLVGSGAKGKRKGKGKGKAVPAKGKGKGKQSVKGKKVVAKGKAKAVPSATASKKRAREVVSPIPAPPATSSRRGGRLPPPTETTDTPSSKRRRTTRGISSTSGATGQNSVGGEGWEEIPTELLEQWKKEEEKKNGDDDDWDRSSLRLAKGGEEEEEEGEEGEEEEGGDGDEVMSDLTSLGELSGRGEEDEFSPDDDDEEEEEEEEEEEVEEYEPGTFGEVEGEMPLWEKEYYAERKRAETPGFIEWEAVCVSLEDWKNFTKRFDDSKDRGERSLRSRILNEFMPYITEYYENLESERQKQIALENRKRSTRIAIKETTAEDLERLAAEQAEALSRASRASRHRIVNYNLDDPDGVNGSVGGGGGPRVPETREERLRKREEEKRAKEEQAEREAIRESEKLARTGSTGTTRRSLHDDDEEYGEEGNDTMLEAGPSSDVGLVDGQTAEQRRTAERERKKEIKRLRDAENKRARTARRALEKLEAEKLLAEEGWYLDCELCAGRGWMVDDGSEIIQCDQCDVWVHMICATELDARAGRPQIDYATLPEEASFTCSRCHKLPTRDKSVVPPAPVAPNEKALERARANSENYRDVGTPVVTGNKVVSAAGVGGGTILKVPPPPPTQPQFQQYAAPSQQAYGQPQQAYYPPQQAAQYYGQQAYPSPQTGYAQPPQQQQPGGYYNPQYQPNNYPSQSAHAPQTNGGTAYGSSPRMRQAYPSVIGGASTSNQQQQQQQYGYPSQAQSYQRSPAFAHATPAQHHPGYSQTAQHQQPHPPQQPQHQGQQQQQGEGPMSYEQLKELVSTNPAVLGRLPLEYQTHFSQLLGIPMPSSSSIPTATSTTTAPATGGPTSQGPASSPRLTQSGQQPSVLQPADVQEQPYR